MALYSTDVTNLAQATGLSALDTTGSFSVALWHRKPDASVGVDVIRHSAATAADGWAIFRTTNQVRVRVWNGSTATDNDFQASIGRRHFTTEWIHLAVTADGTSVCLYLDGKLIQRQAQAANPTVAGTRTTTVGNAGVFPGKPAAFHDVRVWAGRAISPSQVRLAMAGGRIGDETAKWFTRGRSGIDLTGNGNNLTLAATATLEAAPPFPRRRTSFRMPIAGTILQGFANVTCQGTTPPLEFYASDTGSSSNPGTIGSPWSLAYAFSGAGGQLVPGSTCWIRGATYVGDWVISVSGSVGLKTTFRAYNYERVVLDSTSATQNRVLRLTGNYLKLWGVELQFTGSSIRTSSKATGGSDTSNPTDIGNRGWKEFRNEGHDNEIINCVGHDLCNGFTDQNVATSYNSKWHGYLAFNNGWDGTDSRGHGHGCYCQNSDASGKLIEDSVFYGQFSSGIKLAGSGAALVRHFTVRGCASFDPGDLATIQGQDWNLHNEGGGDAGGNGLGDVLIEDSSFYRKNDAAQEFLKLNVAGDPTCLLGYTYRRNISNCQPAFNETNALSATDNTFAFGSSTPGQIRLPAVRLDTPEGYSYATYTFDRNAYYSLTSNFPWSVNLLDGAGSHNYNSLAAWQAATNWDLSSTHTAANKPSVAQIVYRANSYETGRGWAYCWNWAAAGSLNLDLSQVGLSPGDNYEIYHVYNVDRPYPPTVNACNTGTYGGGTVAVTQTGYTPPTPYGWTGAASTNASPDFNVFLVRKVA